MQFALLLGVLVQGLLRRQHPCDTAVTDSDRLDCARATLEDILARQQQAAAQDTSKEEMCTEHAADLETNLEQAGRDLETAKHNLEAARYAEAQCPHEHACSDYWTIRGEMLSRYDDVEYYENKIKNLEDQVESLRAWCSV